MHQTSKKKKISNASNFYFNFLIHDSIIVQKYKIFKPLNENCYFLKDFKKRFGIFEVSDLERKWINH